RAKQCDQQLEPLRAEQVKVLEKRCAAQARDRIRSATSGANSVNKSSTQLWLTLDPQCRCRRRNPVLRDLGAVRGNGRARRSNGRRSPIGRCQSGRAVHFMWNSASTGYPSIQAHGGPQTKARSSRMMMRKTSLILLGATAGVAVTLIATQPRIVLDGARAQAAAAD